MPEESQKNSSIPLNVPVAIVIAGALIAAAIYFGGGGSLGLRSGAKSGGAAARPTGAAQPAAEPAQAGVGDFRDIDDTDHVRGAVNAKVTVIEYSDIECPFCKRFHPTVKQLLEEFPNDVQWVYRHFPLESIHPNARIAAIATECAGEQGKFWELTDYLFESTSSGAELAKSQLPEHARAAGVPDLAAFQTCLDEERYDDRVSADLADAQAAGGQGTPYSIVIGPDGAAQPLSGAQPYATVKATVESLL